MKKIGIFSGSFDPVHEGHIAFADEAMRRCGLDTVVFMPERFPRGKPNISPISERVTELEIALAATPFVVLDLMADTFSVKETVPELKLLYPDAIFTFLIGSDVALKLSDWHDIQRLTEHYEFAVGMRTGDAEAEITAVLRSLHAQFTVVKSPLPHLSSSSLKG